MNTKNNSSRDNISETIVWLGWIQKEEKNTWGEMEAFLFSTYQDKRKLKWVREENEKWDMNQQGEADVRKLLKSWISSLWQKTRSDYTLLNSSSFFPVINADGCWPDLCFMQTNTGLSFTRVKRVDKLCVTVYNSPHLSVKLLCYFRMLKTTVNTPSAHTHYTANQLKSH